MDNDCVNAIINNEASLRFYIFDYNKDSFFIGEPISINDAVKIIEMNERSKGLFYDN